METYCGALTFGSSNDVAMSRKENRVNKTQRRVPLGCGLKDPSVRLPLHGSGGPDGPAKQPKYRAPRHGTAKERMNRCERHWGEG